jgi:hypothetical protein
MKSRAVRRFWNDIMLEIIWIIIMLEAGCTSWYVLGGGCEKWVKGNLCGHCSVYMLRNEREI